MTYKENNTERDQSDFNNALGYINRIDLQFQISNQAKLTNDANSWYKAMLNLAAELSTYMKPEEIERIKQFTTENRKDINQFLRIASLRGKNRMPHDLYDRLYDFELWLRTIYKRSDLQTKSKEKDPRASSYGTSDR